MKEHRYNLQLDWTGNTGEGTTSYRSYTRDYTIGVAGKPPLLGSSDPAFRGDPTRHNPEDLLLAALSSCHLLWYLHLCAVNGVSVLAYTDRAEGVMQEEKNGAGQFSEVVLRPRVEIRAGGDVERAKALHQEVHHFCFIARSVNFPVTVVPEVTAV